ncbi:MAG: hypothetical protein WC495_04825, partial [Patescibacteria group bacterium]
VGIKTGCRVDEALRLYPDVILVEVDPPKYRTVTERIFSICKEYTSDIELYSIDEGFLDFTGLVPSLDEATRIGYTIKKRIKSEVGEWLDCSMGVSFTRWLAKFGGDTAPKAGLVIINRDNLFQYIKGRDLEDAWGIAGATAARLNALGIRTLDELARYPVVNLMEVLGIRGYELWANVNGIEMHGLERERTPKSVGHSHVLRRRTRDINFHKSIVMRLCERTGRRLRDLGLEAWGVYAHASLEKRGGIGGSKKINEPLTSTRTIYSYVWNILKDGVEKDIATFYSLGLFRLRPKTNQLSLFTKPKPERLIQALDEINNRYGEEVIAQGELAKLDKYHAPDRIGFRKTIGLDV